jgi:hypothetical protein
MKQSRFADERIIAILRGYRGVRRRGRAQQPRQILLILLSITFSLTVGPMALSGAFASRGC